MLRRTQHNIAGQSLEASINKMAQEFDFTSPKSVDRVVDTLATLADALAAPVLATPESAAPQPTLTLGAVVPAAPLDAICLVGT